MTRMLRGPAVTWTCIYLETIVHWSWCCREHWEHRVCHTSRFKELTLLHPSSCVGRVKQLDQVLPKAVSFPYPRLLFLSDPRPVELLLRSCHG
jgi:hypothetical protein